jgi:hypothetical protein
MLRRSPIPPSNDLGRSPSHPLLALASTAGCSSGEHASAAADLSIPDVTGSLAPGERGPEVLAIHDYLRGHGYLPDASLSEQYPNWIPVVNRTPSDPSYFGPELEEAVAAFDGGATSISAAFAAAPMIARASGALFYWQPRY